MVHTSRLDLLTWRAGLPLAVLGVVAQLAAPLLGMPFLLCLLVGTGAGIGAAWVVDRASLRGRAVVALATLAAAVMTVGMPIGR